MHVINKNDENVLERPFLKMGARVKFSEPVATRWNREPRPVALDIRSDRKGEFFLVSKRADVTVEVLEVQPAERHLVLLARVPESGGTETKSRFLLGHDERHWFVAAIPEQDPVSTVRAAKQALKPVEVRNRERRVRNKARNHRSNAARIRQGEWFFAPARHIPVKEWLIRKNEPLVRGNGGKPHICQELFRVGGDTVYVHPGFNRVLSVAAYSRLSEKARTKPGWRTMVRNPRVFVRGTVRHPDHKTIFLEGWHEVYMNTETRAAAMRHVAFLD